MEFEGLGQLFVERQIRWQRAALKIVKSNQNTEDIVQTAMYKTLHSAKDLSHRGKMEHYVLKAVRTVACDFARIRARTCLIDPSDAAIMSLPSLMPDPLRTLLREEQRQRFRAALKRLPSDQRTLIEMFLQAGTTRSLTAISQSTGLPISTIRSRIQSGLRKMKKLINKGVS